MVFIFRHFVFEKILSGIFFFFSWQCVFGLSVNMIWKYRPAGNVSGVGSELWGLFYRLRVSCWTRILVQTRDQDCVGLVRRTLGSATAGRCRNLTGGWTFLCVCVCWTTIKELSVQRQRRIKMSLMNTLQPRAVWVIFLNRVRFILVLCATGSQSWGRDPVVARSV